MHAPTLQAATIARLTRSILIPAATAAALAALLWQLLGPGAIGYDTAHALAWGDALARLETPDFGAALSPTPHPLANLAGLAASLFGASGPDVLLALSYLAGGALGVGAFLLGRRTFGAVAGVAFAAILLTRPFVVAEVLQASIDVPFLALVLLAAALAAERPPERAAAGARPRRETAPLALLALAGLLRPEAWLLSLAYAAWVRTPRAFALAAVAPVLWSLHDLALTGDPVHSLTGTQDLAAQLERERGLGSALDVMPSSLEAILRPGVLWAGLAACGVVLFAAQARARLPLAVLGLGLAGFLLLGVFELPLLVRYLVVPGAMLALFCAAGLAAFAWLPAPRAAGAATSAAVAVALALGAPGTLDGIDSRRAQAQFAHAVDGSLLALAEDAPRCAPVQSSTHRSVPLLAYALERGPSEIAVVPPVRDRGLLFAARAEVVGSDIEVERDRPVADVPLPRGFDRLAANDPWTLGARCPTS